MQHHPEDHPLRKLRLKAQNRKSQILSTAMNLFAERGFQAARTREVAARAGVSEALIFRHFPTKEALVESILDLIGADEKLQALEGMLDEQSPRDTLVAIAERMFTNLRHHPETFRLVFFGMLERPDLAREIYRRFLARVLAIETLLFERAFDEQRRRGNAVETDPQVAARSFHGSLLFYNLAAAIAQVEPPPADPRATAEAVVSLYLPKGES